MREILGLACIKEVFIFIAAYSVLLVIALLCDYWQEKRLDKTGKD